MPVGQYALVAVIALVLGAAIARADALVALVVPATLGVLLLILAQRFLQDRERDPAEEARLARWTMGAFAAHLLFGIAVTYTPAALKYLGGDANTYHVYASWMLDFGKSSLGKYGLEHGKEGFYYTLLGLYKVFGPHQVAGLALNATLGAALVPVVTDSTRRLFGRVAARNVAPIVVLLPGVFLFTSQLLKEASILFLVSVAANAAIRTMHRFSLGAIAVTAVCVSVLLTFRAPVAFVVGGALLLGITLGKKQVLSGFTTGLGTLAILAVMVTTVGIGYSGFQSTLQKSNLAESNKIRQGLAYQSGTGFGSDVDTGTTSKALAYLPIALVNFGFGPFPWQIRGARQLPALVDVIALWILWPSLGRALRQTVRERKRQAAVIIVPALAVASVLSLSVGNLGVLVRERMQVLVLVVPLMAYGLSLRGRHGPTEEPVAAAPVAVPA